MCLVHTQIKLNQSLSHFGHPIPTESTLLSTLTWLARLKQLRQMQQNETLYYLFRSTKTLHVLLHLHSRLFMHVYAFMVAMITYSYFDLQLAIFEFRDIIKYEVELELVF